MGVKKFFKDAFSDMKESTKAQHEVDKANFVAKVVALPEREDVDFDFEEQLIVELYSK